MRTRCERLICLAFILVASAAIAPSATAQQILLDEPVRAGELILFRDLNDENVYYYVADKPGLARDASGRPQFSFLRYVENTPSGANEAENREGEGGGIVHALVALSVSREQLRDAERELGRIKSEAVIRGPIVFRAGKFGLVSSFADTEGNLSMQVVGLGNAPLLDGEKAAVSLQLTKLGSKILWQSFQTPTPDISFTFEMDMDGYRLPKRAVIEANFDQIYDHKAFGAGISSKYLAAEIKFAFDDLRKSGAIKLTQVGDDEDLDALITTAYNKIADLMFQPMEGAGAPDFAGLTGGQEGGSLLDRATTMLRQNREETRERNAEIRERNAEADESAASSRRTERMEEQTTAAEERAADLEQQADEAEARADRLRQRSTELASGEEFPEEWASSNREIVEGIEQQAATLRRLAEEARTDAAELEGEIETARTGSGSSESGSGSAEREEEEEEPKFAIVAAFEMKRVRQRGNFRVDLNKYTADSLTLRFDENIGDLSRLIGDDRHFRQVNLDDPLFRQREIVAFVDGLNASDFGQFVNFVTVQLRKRHQSGEESYEEVRIDRKNFNTEGNNFKLLYGWKGDDDRRRWLEYDYKTQWSFFGGGSLEAPWQTATSGAINLAPPLRRRQVTLEADPELLEDSGVRMISVKVFCDVAGTEVVREATLNTSKGQLSGTLDVLLPADTTEYDYEISWRLRGNQTVSSGRQTASASILFVDELPES